MWKEWREKKEELNDIKVWWDLGKKHIKEVAIWCANHLAKERKYEVTTLENRIQYLRHRGIKTDEITQCEQKLKEIYIQKSEGTKIRSRVRWWEEGEKPTAYFHNLEKKNAKSKLWESILDADGQVLHGTESVQRVQVDFYKELYHSQNLQCSQEEKIYSKIQ